MLGILRVTVSQVLPDVICGELGSSVQSSCEGLVSLGTNSEVSSSCKALTEFRSLMKVGQWAVILLCTRDKTCQMFLFSPFNL